MNTKPEVQPAPQPSKQRKASRAELEHRIESAVEALKIAQRAKSVATSRTFVEAALGVLDA